MDSKTERNLIEKKDIILKEIEYRESVMRQLSFDTYRKKHFFLIFIRSVLGFKKQLAPGYREDETGEYIYRIDSDVELQKDIYNALEKSKNKLIEQYNSL